MTHRAQAGPVRVARHFPALAAGSSRLDGGAGPAGPSQGGVDCAPKGAQGRESGGPGGRLALGRGIKRPGDWYTPGSRLPAPGSRLPAPGSRLPAPGSRLPAPGSRLPAPSTYGRTRYGRTRYGRTRYGRTRYGRTRVLRPRPARPERARTSAPIHRRVGRARDRFLTVSEGHLFTPAMPMSCLVRLVQPVPNTGPGQPAPGLSRAAAHSARPAAPPPGNLLNALALLFLLA